MYENNSKNRITDSAVLMARRSLSLCFRECFVGKLPPSPLEYMGTRFLLLGVACGVVDLLGGLPDPPWPLAGVVGRVARS